MTIEEQKSIIDEILTNHTDQSLVSTNLATLTEDYTKVTSDLQSATSSAEKLKEENEKLRQANLNLFLKIGEQPKGDISKAKEEEDKTPTFEQLFDDNGNLL